MEIPKDIKWTIAKHLDYFDILNFLPGYVKDPNLWKFLSGPIKYEEDPKTNFMIQNAKLLYDQFYLLKNRIGKVSDKEKEHLQAKKDEIAKEYNKLYMLLTYETKYYHTNTKFGAFDTLLDLEQIIGKTLNPGNIVGTGGRKSEQPSRLAFIGKDRSLYLAKDIYRTKQLPKGLTDMMRKQCLSRKDLKTLYGLDLNFATTILEPFDDLEKLKYFPETQCVWSTPKNPDCNRPVEKYGFCKLHLKTTAGVAAIKEHERMARKEAFKTKLAKVADSDSDSDSDD